MNPDTLALACHIVADEWGPYGYAVEDITPSYGAGAIHVVASDGSRFTLAVDRYGCHHAHRENDGTRASMALAATRALAAVRNAHEIDQRLRMAEAAR